MFVPTETDATLPDISALKSTLDREFIEIIVELHCNFNNYDKVVAWLYTENPHFGSAMPMQLIAVGRGSFVLRFIQDAEKGDE